ncbi:FecR domain-containing protein [Desulfobacterales bacterium HSG17]|nr:FecR domain-containing protein [Desulfobacterales bacterium HSG17]
MKLIQILFQLPVIICFGFVLFILPPAFAIQTEPVGKVVAIRNNVTATGSDSICRKLVLKSSVFLQDTIKTNQGRVQMMFKDKTIITLGRNSEMKITKYLWEPDNSDSTMVTEINEGSFRIMGGAITRIAPDNFKTNTPSGTIGIRGSMYAGLLKGTMLSVVFQGGKGVYVRNKAGMVNITRPGFATKVKSLADPPEMPAKLTQEDLIKLENTLALAPEEESIKILTSSEAIEPSPLEPGVTENKSQPDSVIEATEPTGDQSGNQTVATDTFEPDALSTDPVPAEPLPADPVLLDVSGPDFLSDTSSVINDAVVTSVQTDLSSTISPTGTQQTILFMLLELGFTGTESTSIPSTGIWSYSGKMNNTIVNETPENMKFIVNWDNQRIMALEDFSTDHNHINSGFAFGDVNASGSISNLTILGSDSHSDAGAVMALTGSETFGSFYGTGQEGLGLAMEGYDYNIQNQTDSTFWSDIAAATVNNKTTNPYSGTETWNGFYVGIAENMASPNTNRRAFLNNSSSEYTLSINKDTGIFSGTMSAGIDFYDAESDSRIDGLTVGGGSTTSAYITDQLFAASLSGANVITIDSSSTGGLKTYGNFMVTSNKTALSNHTTWGYWEVAYTEPGGTEDYHIHVPGSRWIAGKQTLSTVISNLISTSFSGTYTGGAQGVMFDNSSQMMEMSNGTTNLTIDFASTASQPVSGSISFDQITLPVTSTTGDLTSSGFQATISSATQSNVNGTFYGTGAEGVGGNFAAAMADGKQYHGIFAGDR